MGITRRKLLQATLSGSAMALLGFSTTSFASNRRVVVIGGGSGGATAARYLRMADPTIEVILIEANATHHTCLMSNEVITGRRDINTLRFNYVNLGRLGIKLIHDKVIAIDPDARQIRTQDGTQLQYDRCILSPGIDFRWEQITGYNAQIAETFPHAWKSGTQITTLQQQLQAMRDGDTCLIAVPAAPYRCPTAPYERASLMAHYLQQHKPKSKVVILDANPTFPNQKAFVHAWETLYHFAGKRSLIERQSGREAAVTELDVANRTLLTASGTRIKADLINIIPPQQAGEVAITSGLADESGWCPIDLLTFESRLQSNIHIIGDAAITNGMSKLGASANAQGKVCAAAVAALLNGQPPTARPLIETSYAIIGQEFGISATAVFKSSEDGSKLDRLSGGASAAKTAKWQHQREYYNAHSWYNNITRDIFL